MLHVGERVDDEVFLLKNFGVEPHIGRERGLQFGQRPLDVVGQGHGIRAGLFFYGQIYCGAGVHRSIAALDGCAETHIGHLTQQHGQALPVGDHRLLQILQIFGPTQHRDEYLRAVAVEKTARRVQVGVFEGTVEVFERQVGTVSVLRKKPRLGTASGRRRWGSPALHP